MSQSGSHPSPDSDRQKKPTQGPAQDDRKQEPGHGRGYFSNLNIHPDDAEQAAREDPWYGTSSAASDTFESRLNQERRKREERPRATVPEATIAQIIPAKKIETIQTRSVIKVISLLVISLIFFWFLWRVREPLTWLLIATILAVSLSGPVNLLSRYMPRPISITIVYLILVLMPIGIAFLMVPPLIDQVNNISGSLPSSGVELEQQIDKIGWLRDLNNNIDISTMISKLAETLPGQAGSAATFVAGAGKEIASLIFALFMIISMSIFLIVYGHRWVHTGLEWLPTHTPRDRIERALERIAAAVSGYVNGAIIQAIIAGTLAYVVLHILNIPFAGGLAVIVGLLDLVPIVGSLISTILVALVTIGIDFPVATIIWVVFAIAYQQLENNIIQPRVQSQTTSLNAFLVLLAVLFGAALMGIIGALLAIPVAASIKIALTEWLTYRAEIHAEEEGIILERISDT